MKIFLLFLFLLASFIFAQDPLTPVEYPEDPVAENPEDPVAENPEDPVAENPEDPVAENPEEPITVNPETPKDPVVATEETPDKQECPMQKHCEEARKFWLGMSFNEMLIGIALLAQILERLLEILFVAFGAQSFKKKVLISAFFGTLLASGLCYVTQAHVLLDKLPSIVYWHEAGKVATMGFILYCCAQPIHRILSRRSSADLVKTVVENSPAPKI